MLFILPIIYQSNKSCLKLFLVVGWVVATDALRDMMTYGDDFKAENKFIFVIPLFRVCL